MHAFSPGTSPPPVRTPILTGQEPTTPVPRGPQVASTRGAARRLGPASPRLAGADLPRLARVAGRDRRDLLALRDRPAVPEPRPAVATLRISRGRAPSPPRREAPPAPRPARRSPPASRPPPRTGSRIASSVPSNPPRTPPG